MFILFLYYWYPARIASAVLTLPAALNTLVTLAALIVLAILAGHGLGGEIWRCGGFWKLPLCARSGDAIWLNGRFES